ncbi:MAG: glutathione S-transferase family protein [Sphingomonas sp.]|nr:glutathione S-transferase family protein [Sphingomonas sp.]RZV51274.1 MAG: glutathione S-transferase family protein [Sphingomonadaceae bacterium]
MIVYGSSMSPFVRKVIAVLTVKGVDFNLKSVGFQDPDPDFRAASPLGKMPAIDDDGYKLADSSAICHYIEARHPEPTLIPGAAEDRGRVIWWDKYADTVLMPTGGKIFFNRVVAPVFMKMPGDDEMADKAEADELPVILDYLEREVPDAGSFLVGDSLSLADISLASPFANLSHAGVSIDEGRFARVKAWTDSMLAHPCLAGSVARERAFFEKMGAPRD